VDLTSSVLSSPYLVVYYSIPAHAGLTATSMGVNVYDVDTGAVLNTSARYTNQNVSTGVSFSGWATDLTASNGHLVRIEIYWLNGTVASGATIEFDDIQIWDGI
jgi:hypothetical protein